MLTHPPAPLPLTQRWRPPSWPTSALDLAPGCPLAREFAAFRALQDTRTVPESAELVALHDQVAHFQQVASDPDATAADAWAADRALRTLQPDLERAESQHAERQKARLSEIVKASEAWQQRWQQAMKLRAEYETVARAAYSESLGAWHGKHGPERPSEYLPVLDHKLEALFGPHTIYAARRAHEDDDADA